MKPQTVSGQDIDWSVATEAAERLLKICQNSGYVSPDNSAGQQKYLNDAASCMSKVADALRLTRGGGRP